MGIIQRQGIWNTIISYTGIIIGFVNVLFIQPRFLSTEELGLVRVLYSFSSVIAMFLPLGIGSITLRYFPQFRDKEKGHHGLFGLNMLFPLAGFIFIAAILLVLKPFITSQYEVQSKLFTDYFYMVFPFLFILSYVSVLGIYASGLFKTIFTSFLNDILVRLLSIVLVSVYFIKLINRDQFIYCFVLIYGLQALLLMIYIIFYDRPSWIPDLTFIRTLPVKKMFGFGVMLWFIALAGYALKTLDMVLLGKYVPLKLVGIYSVCAFIPLVIETPLIALDRISAPKIGEAWSRNDLKEIKDIYYKSSHYLFMIGALMACGILANADDLIRLLPADYAVGKYVINIVAIGTLFNMSTGLNDPVLFYSARYKVAVIILLLMLFLGFLFYNLLIPAYGIEGAAIGAMLINLIYNIIKFMFIKIRFNLQPFGMNHLKIIVPAVLILLLGIFIPLPENVILAISIRSFFMFTVYAFMIYKMKLAPDIVSFFKK